jgi:hypothetical protein
VLLGTASTVGHRQERPAQPGWKATLVVPLNARAAQALAGRREIELTLRIRNNASHPPLEVDRAYFRTDRVAKPGR